MKCSIIKLINSSCKLNGIYILKASLRGERIVATTADSKEHNTTPSNDNGYYLVLAVR
jgi:hypothetical protein